MKIYTNLALATVFNYFNSAVYPLWDDQIRFWAE